VARLLASGRAADVYDLGDGTVLRRYREDHDADHEARVMRWAREHRVAVPRVHHVEGRDLVMDLVEGPTLLEDLQRRPWMVVAHARTLARLQRSLGAVPAPPWLKRCDDDVPEGGSLLHLDLHPMNVIASPDGPVLIDWTNASRGDAAFDAATSYVLMATFEVAAAHERLGRRLLVGSFVATRGRATVRRHLAAACIRRLRDTGTTEGERAAVEALRRRNPL
jgi:aminoglycoside phosphotransferase (APT) family kinase protein